MGKALVLKPFQVLTKSNQGLNYWAREQQSMTVKLRAKKRVVRRVKNRTTGVWQNEVEEETRVIAEAAVNIRQIAMEKCMMRNFNIPFKKDESSYTFLECAMGVTGGDVFD